MRRFLNATRTTKMIAAAVAASAVFAGVYGFAASLGVTSAGLGAGNAVVAACGTGITAAYTTAYSSTIPGYSVSQVNLASIPAACLSKSYRIQLTGAAGATVGAEMTGTLHASGTTGTLAAGSTTVGGCTSSALTATRNVNNSGSITQVNVLNVPQECSGETLAVTLESTGGAVLAASSAVVGTCTGGCTVSVTGFGTAPATSATAYALSLTQ